jgi:hypothetical protein
MLARLPIETEHFRTSHELLRRSVWDLTPDAHRGRGQAMWRAFLARGRMAGGIRYGARAAGS